MDDYIAELASWMEALAPGEPETLLLQVEEDLWNSWDDEHHPDAVMAALKEYLHAPASAQRT